MDFEKTFRPKKSEVSPRELLRSCQNLADVLTRGGWFDDEHRQAAIEREVGQHIGSPIGPDGAANDPRSEFITSTIVNFRGDKSIVRADEYGTIFEEDYRAGTTVTQIIHYSELPDRILLGIGREAQDSDHEDNDEIENDDDSYFLEDLSYLSLELIESYVFERQQEIGYVIDDAGEIDDYYVAYRYLVDETVIEETKYSWDDSGEFLMSQHEPSSIINESIIEWRKPDLDKLDARELALFKRHFDEIIANVTLNERFDILSDEMDLEEGEHIRRAMAIVAMAGHGFNLPK